MDSEKVAIFCVGNRLMLDDGLGPAVYDELTSAYEFPGNVELHDVGCMGLGMINHVDECDYIVTVDAVDGTGEPAGTVFEFDPDDMERHHGASASLHELTLADLFDAAALLGFACEGKCFGMQVENMSPAVVTVGLTPPVHGNVPLLVDALLADLYSRGIVATCKATGEPISPGWHHAMSE